MKNRRIQGFTLIELSLVVVLIGIVSALSVMRFRDYTINAKLAEPKGLLKKMWEMCYVYYMTNATAVTDDGVPMYFGFNTGNATLDAGNLKKLNLLGLDMPNGKMRFWYVTTEEAVCYAFPKKTTDPFGFTIKETDGDLAKYELAIDNDGRIYLYKDGNVRELD